jgi:hypothetical protein
MIDPLPVAIQAKIDKVYDLIAAGDKAGAKKLYAELLQDYHNIVKFIEDYAKALSHPNLEELNQND